MKVEFSGGTGTLNQGFGYRQFRGEMCSKDKLNMIFLHFCEEKSFNLPFKTHSLADSGYHKFRLFWYTGSATTLHY